jgi:hypothetical protein
MALPLPRATAGAGPPPLDYPIAAPPRIAVLGAEVHRQSGIHSLPRWTVADLARLRPMALAGPWADLAAAARLLRAGQLQLPELHYPLVVFTRAGTPPLGPDRHAQLWEWYGLPAFEQIRSSSFRLLAMECESRQGFHLAPGADPRQLDAHAGPGACPCGSTQPLYRLAPARALAAAGD